MRNVDYHKMAANEQTYRTKTNITQQTKYLKLTQFKITFFNEIHKNASVPYT